MKIKIRQDTLLEQYNKDDQCVYYGIINNKSNDNEPLVKFGNSKDLRTRVATHQKTYDGFYLVNAFRVNNKFQIETEMKKHPLFQMYQRTIEINGKNYVELLAVDKLSFDELNKIIRTIIHTMSMVKTEKYNKLLEEKVSAPLIPVAYSCRINNENLVAPVDCSSCDYRTYNQSNYSNHLTSNNQKKNAYSCECCNYVTNQKSHYSDHMASKAHEYKKIVAEKGIKSNQCENCFHEFNSKSSLWRHKKNCKPQDHPSNTPVNESENNKTDTNDAAINVLVKQNDYISVLTKKNDELLKLIMTQNQQIVTLVNTLVTRGLFNNANNSHNANHANSHN
jgi:hypothetical protein